MDDLTPYLSPRVVTILHLFKKHGSLEAVRAVDPSITDQEVDQVTAEVGRAICEFGLLFSSPTQAGKAKRKKSAAGGAGYQLKITLRGSKPPIWRRVIVPADMYLDRLHTVIQIAMGWSDCHLHLFEIDREFYQEPDPDGFESDRQEDERKYRLCDLVNREKAKFRYEYDFGDSWDHVIILEKIIPASEKPELMVCLTGKNACPVEDSGGIWGYYEKLRIVGDPTHPEHELIKEWMGEIDPTEFDIHGINALLHDLR
jgi:hypothetical protein